MIAREESNASNGAAGNRDIEGAATQIEHEQRPGVAAVWIVQAVCQRCGGRFIEKTLDLQSGQFAGEPGGA
jgi:hypothetical protein